MPANLLEQAPALAQDPALAAAAGDWALPPPSACLTDRVILVTGAGDGIGATAARCLAAFGAHVVLLGRTRSKLETVFDWISTHTATRPVIVPCDLEHLADSNVDALGAAIEEEFGALHGLLHNASLLGPKVPLAHFPADDWRRVFEVNVHAPMMLTRTLQPLLTQDERTSVVFTSSSVGRTGRAYWGGYAASKFATEGLMQVFADEVENISNICALSLNPGGTRTAMRAAAYPAEDPDTVPTAASLMDRYVALFRADLAVPRGAALSLRTAADWDWVSAG
jgi:NAD(P)-dependent dehydrogenase (short-subunit alcohol dehydrogenase family)